MRSKKALIWLVGIAVVGVTVLAGCFVQKAEAQSAPVQTVPQTEDQSAAGLFRCALPYYRAEAQGDMPPVAGERPVVYMTTNITPAGLMAVYEALGLQARGKVAVKIHTGEPGNTHFLSPNLIRDLVQRVNGTIVECNTVPGSRRAAAAAHYQVAQDHGFTAIAPVVIMDERSEISIPVSGGKHLRENFVGARFSEFDSHVVLSHFKGHPMGGFGGALKNISIGYASSGGKSWIHSAGKTKNTGWRSNDQNAFLESMAEAAKSVIDQTQGNILYINVMNHLSVDCDCLSRPAAPTMADIGILGSLDPVALDQACVDLVFAAQDGRDIVRRIEGRNGLLILEHAQRIGIGNRTYDLRRL